MKKLKDMFLGTFGVVGYVIWLLISFAVMFAPLWFLDFSFLIYLLITIVLFIPFIGGITNFVLWVWSFGVVLSQPIDGWSVFYFAIFLIYAITTILPYIIQFVINIFSLLTNRNS